MQQSLYSEGNRSMVNQFFFMELEGSLPCSQEPATCPYTKPNKTRPCHPILFISDPF